MFLRALGILVLCVLLRYINIVFFDEDLFEVQTNNELKEQFIPTAPLDENDPPPSYDEVMNDLPTYEQATKKVRAFSCKSKKCKKLYDKTKEFKKNKENKVLT